MTAIDREKALEALQQRRDHARKYGTSGLSAITTQGCIDIIAALPVVEPDESKHRDRLRPLGGNYLFDAVDHLEEIDSTDVRDTEHLETAISAIKRFLALPVLETPPPSVQSLADLQARYDALQAKVSEVVEVHEGTPVRDVSGEWEWCNLCDEKYPCRTVAILSDTSTEGEGT